MFSTQSQSLLRRNKGRLSTIGTMMPRTDAKARRRFKKDMNRRMSGAWSSMQPLRSRRALGWFGGALAILSAVGIGYSFYSKKRRDSFDSQDW